MPTRPSLFDLQCRNETICRACLSLIRRQPAPVVQSWTATYSTQAARGRSRLRARHALRAPPITSRTRGLDTAQTLQKLQGDRGQAEQDETNDFTVRYFEKEEQDQKITRLPDEQAFNEALTGPDMPSIKTSFFGMLKSQIKSNDGRNAFQEVVDQLNIDWDNIRTDEDMERARQRMAAYTASIDAEIERTSNELPRGMREELRADMAKLTLDDEALPAGSRTVPQIPEDRWTLNQRRKISRLNAVLARVSGEMQPGLGLTEKMVLAVFKAYHAARFSLAHGWGNVPVEVWDMLWKILSADESINTHRLSHISMLARDMSDAKVVLAPAQQILTIEAVFVDGWESKAVDNWRRCMSTLGDERAETFQDFWELGVRMYSRLGDMEQAERAVARLLTADRSPRILMTMIRTYSEQGTTESQEKAWDAYRKMRELLGQTMKLSDYDQVISYFLTTNQTENALYAFVDMMSEGTIDLKKQRYMPSVVANKFFLGKWLKRLIGAGDLDGAYEVVKFMRHKGVEAAPIQLNGLIGAWQRSGGAENLSKADTLGWELIESRINFVHARKTASENPSGSPYLSTPPRANLETFSLLAENYRLRGLHERLGELWEAFHEAAISPDAFMMNQLLESHIQAGQSKQALQLYDAFVKGRGVVPDPHTFSALWKTLAINRLHVVSDDALGKQAEETRALFAETLRFSAVFEGEAEGETSDVPAEAAAAAAGRMDGQLARKILHTFRRLKDHAGFMVALQVLRERFGFLPPETLVLEIVLGTTKLKWDTAPQRKGLMYAKRDIDRELLRLGGGGGGGDQAAERLEGAARGEALYEYLRAKFRRAAFADAADGDVDAALEEAARDMGVYDVPYGGGEEELD